MFYSHQLLARKAPLGQIWMAATMHVKLNRKKLSKLNIIKICEQILNPSVPMALRLSGILMGGVVIVYERKVKLLLDDVTRLLVEINEAWKLKETSDPTLLPKGKYQAKRRSITLPKNQDEDLGELEQSVQYTNATMGFQRTAFIEMRLDNMDVDDLYVNGNPVEDLTTDCHQADTANITLFERFESYEGDSGLPNRFERFDIQEDEEMQVNSVPLDHMEMPSIFIPSPIPKEEHKFPAADEIQEEHPAEMANKQSEEAQEAIQDQQAERRQVPARRRVKSPPLVAMDDEQTIIPGQIYQSWLQDTSDIIRRPNNRKNMDPMSTVNISRLMDLPPTVLYSRLFINATTQIYYPAPLLQLWQRSIQPPHDSPPGRTSPPQPPEPSSASPTERVHFDPPGYPVEDFQSVIGSPSAGVSIEKQRANVNVEMPADVLMQELQTNLRNVNVQPSELNGSMANLMTTPGNSGSYFNSSGSGPDLQPHYSEVHSGSKKRRHSASLHSGSGLEPVAEESLWHNPDPNFKLARLPENGLTPEIDILVETGPTQTQKPPVLNEPDHITESISAHLKAYFDTPGSPRVESLNHLTSGMNKKRAAHLFYQTCVLATRDIVRLEQVEAYGDIKISRGRKM